MKSLNEKFRELEAALYNLVRFAIFMTMRVRNALILL